MCVMAVAVVGHPSGGGVVGGVDAGVSVASGVDTITVFSVGAPMVGDGRSSEVGDSVTKIVGVIVLEVIGSIDTAIDVVGVWSNGGS